jgi:ArsR family transcriptional regulator
MDEVISIARALSDSNRVRALMALRWGELCLCQIATFLKLAQSTVSKHMSVLRQAGLVTSRRQEKWTFYRIAKTGNGHTAAAAVGWIEKALADDVSIVNDIKRLSEPDLQDRESLCGRKRK